MGENVQKFRERLEQLPRPDKTLLGAFFAFALLALGVGVFAGLVIVSKAAGFINPAPLTVFKYLTIHATYLFYYWIYSVQVGVILALVLAYTEGARLTSTTRGIVWIGFFLVATGFVLNLVAVSQGAVPTYRADYPLIKQFGIAGAIFVLGYILLSLGLFFTALGTLVVAIKPKIDGVVKEWSSVTFASFVWMGLIIVTLVAALLTYVPALQDILGMTPIIPNFKYSMSWGVMFHNLHYLPIMGAVLAWYVLAEMTTGVKSIFGERFSKGIFAIYLLAVPPTSVYHMFLEPGVPGGVKVVGSILSLGVSIPTIAVAMLILASVQACGRGKVGGGAFSWIRHLPWRNPSFSALTMAMVSAIAGGVIANVIIQEKFAVLLGDTFAVPGYFHFFTLGAVTLTFLGILTQVIPAMTGHRIWAPSLMNTLPYLMVGGTYIFGVAGVWAGYTGVPRRTLEYSFGGAGPASWSLPMLIVGIGGLIMVAASGLYALLLILTALRDSPSGVKTEDLQVASFKVEDAAGQNPWLSFVIVAVLLVGIYVASIGAYQLIQNLPIIATGGAGGGH
jgi:cytochrome c oxidase subunit 1